MRPRVAVTAVVSVVTAASISYYIYHRYRVSYDESVPGPGLHRSNAVRHRRRDIRQDDSSESEEAHIDENAISDALVPLGNALAATTDGLEVEDDEWYNNNNQRVSRTGENIVTLLFRVSEDNARRNAYVHRGCQCNGCGMVPIRGVRYRCANCADFDLCEVCESQGLHNKTHVFYKVRIPAPPFGPRQVQPAWYPGDPDNAIRNLPRHLLSKWSQSTGFERVELDAFWEQWTFIANTEWREDPDGLGLAMDRKTFERCLVPSGGYRHAAPNLIHDRMFAFYDTNKDDLIGFEEFLHGVSYRKRKDKLKRTFDGYDIDGDGYVNRKDFLRMFRAYYVLYKQMHRDILEGLDDHMMTTTEAQQLINSRAPLSSLFGREGRVPPADHSRPIEGKLFRSNGDVEVRDGKIGVVNEDKPDTSGREEILSGLFARNSNQSFFTESFGNTSSRHARSSNAELQYWRGIANPPSNMVDLSSLINGDYSQLDDILTSLRHEEAARHSRPEADESGSGSSDEENQTTSEEPGGDSPEENGSTTNHAGSSVRTLPFPDASRFTNTLPTESQLRAQHQAIVANTNRLGLDKRKRIQARKQLLERWRRRAFYLDEEEGALPPQGWDDNEDVLANLNGISESSKSATHPLSPRSRSSSKVRFAEDTDDFDIRSNPSTSSRSVPERWGGMEIPDAERDAGKEILYQVTQQAFNELLDEIFKKKEDLAVQCAETQEERHRNRHLFEHIQLDNESTTPPMPPQDQRDASRRKRPSPIASRSLEELLSTSGYSVGSPPGDHPNNLQNGQAVNAHETGNYLLAEQSPTLVDENEHRDPTMPQFRPNSYAEIPTSAPATHANSLCEGVRFPDLEASGPSVETNGETTYSEELSPTWIPPQETLEMWKRLDLAEEEAKERGGWGKLSYEEFEEIYKEHEFQDSSRNRLDYLGSWIDFCIP